MGGHVSPRSPSTLSTVYRYLAVRSSTQSRCQTRGSGGLGHVRALLDLSMTAVMRNENSVSPSGYGPASTLNWPLEPQLRLLTCASLVGDAFSLRLMTFFGSVFRLGRF